MTLQEVKQQTKLVWWPSPQDYNEAVQNPDVNFSMPQLQGSSIFVGSLGLPRPVCGAFASVYRVRADDHTELAVRCFLRNISDQEARYAMISEFVQNDTLPYTVGFEFAPKGIKIRNDWFPILKMDWVTGQTLDQYVIANVSNSAAIADIASKFLSMCLHLRQAGIAHGDLQHGNILVTPEGDLRLVDYDGMFVPAMNGFQANELGHRNYQHPGRAADHFGPYLDNFAAWVIYASLAILAVDPSLLAQLRGGDESLLFKRSDFEDPLQSQRFAILEAHRNQHIRNLARMVRYNLTLPVDSVPAFTEALPEISLPPLELPIRPPDAKSTGTSGGLPEWLGDALAEKSNLPDWMNQEPGQFVHPDRSARSLQSTVSNIPKFVTRTAPELNQPVPRQTNPDTVEFVIHWKTLLGFLMFNLFMLSHFPMIAAAILVVVFTLASGPIKANLKLKRQLTLVQEGIVVPGRLTFMGSDQYGFTFTSSSGQVVDCFRTNATPEELSILRGGSKDITVIYGGNPFEDAMIYSLSGVKAVKP